MNILDKIKKLLCRTKTDDEKLYDTLIQETSSDDEWRKEELGEDMSLLSEVILSYWKPRFILNEKTKCAYTFMYADETLLVTENDIDWNSLKGIDKNALERAKTRSFHFPSDIYQYKNGVAQVRWQLNPDGMYFMDGEGYGMTCDEEINIYGFIDKKGKVLVKFKLIKNSDELKEMRAMAEKAVAGKK